MPTKRGGSISSSVSQKIEHCSKKGEQLATRNVRFPPIADISVEADIAAMSGRTFNIIFGCVIALLGVVHIIYGFVAKRRGGGFWWAGRNLYLEAEEDGDPVGLRTVAWGNVASGVLMVLIGSYLALTGH